MTGARITTSSPEAWAWLTATQLARAGTAAALSGEAAQNRALCRKTAPRVTADEIFHRRRSPRCPLDDIHLGHGDIVAGRHRDRSRTRRLAALHTLNLPGRQRHSRCAKKACPKFRHAAATKTTVTGKPYVTVFAPAAASCLPGPRAVRRNGPGMRGRGLWHHAPPHCGTRVPGVP